MVNIFRLIGNKLDLFRMCRDVSRCVTMYVELITILVRAKDDITRACRRCQSTLYIVFNIAEVGGPHYRWAAYRTTRLVNGIIVTLWRVKTPSARHAARGTIVSHPQGQQARPGQI